MDKQQFIDEATSFANSTVVSELIDILEANYVTTWKATPAEEFDKREHLYRMVVAVNALRNELRSVSQGGLIKAWNRRLRNQP